jgi:hypothetical protein
LQGMIVSGFRPSPFDWAQGTPSGVEGSCRQHDGRMVAHKQRKSNEPVIMPFTNPLVRRWTARFRRAFDLLNNVLDGIKRQLILISFWFPLRRLFPLCHGASIAPLTMGIET